MMNARAHPQVYTYTSHVNCQRRRIVARRLVSALADVTSRDPRTHDETSKEQATHGRLAWR